MGWVLVVTIAFGCSGIGVSSLSQSQGQYFRYEIMFLYPQSKLWT
jgi:hypothetical protein